MVRPRRTATATVGTWQGESVSTLCVCEDIAKPRCRSRVVQAALRPSQLTEGLGEIDVFITSALKRPPGDREAGEPDVLFSEDVIGCGCGGARHERERGGGYVQRNYLNQNCRGGASAVKSDFETLHGGVDRLFGYPDKWCLVRCQWLYTDRSSEMSAPSLLERNIPHRHTLTSPTQPPGTRSLPGGCVRSPRLATRILS